MIEVSIIEFWPEDCKSLCLLSCGAYNKFLKSTIVVEFKKFFGIFRFLVLTNEK